MNIMAGMTQAGKPPSSRVVYAAVVLVAACLLAGCGLAMGEEDGAEERVDVERAASAGTPERPNVILILADDLDAASISHMPNLRSLLIERGTTFENAFVTDPLCCPSRATILRGQYAHNHDILGERAGGYVGRPGGGPPPFFVPPRPFFMWLGTTAPHQPADPAPRHEGALADVSLPRPPSFDEEDVSDKPNWI